MKTKCFFSSLIILSSLFFASISRALDITAISSGSWGDTNIWNIGTVPGTNDDADIPVGINVTVDTNAFVQYIYDAGTVTMAPNSTLNVVGDSAGAEGTQSLGLLDTSAVGNTVIYSGNAFWAKHQNYYNLVLNGGGTLYNGNIGEPGDGQVAMSIAGNMTLGGTVHVQEADNITVNGNLTLGNTNNVWDCSSYNLTVLNNTIISGRLTDEDGANGADVFNNVILNTGGTLNILDSTNWFVNGSLTNNGGAIVGIAYASINFDGTGIISGNPITIPTLTINGTYTIGTTVNLTTNTPTLNGTLVFDLANPQQIVLSPAAGSGPTLYYSGTLDVINTGAAPISGSSYQFFNAQSYGGSFAASSFPSLSNGLTWINNLATSGSIAISGGSIGSPVISLSKNGNLWTLSWNSATYPGYSVQAQTNSAGIGTNWSATGSGTVSPFYITINPTNPPVFFRLSNP